MTDFFQTTEGVVTAASVYVDPIFAANTLPTGVGDKRNTFYVGIGARVKIVPALFLVGEVSPRVAGYKQGDPELAFSLEKRVGGHVFSLVIVNTQATTYGQLARGANPETLYIGFNLARKCDGPDCSSNRRSSRFSASLTSIASS